MRLALGLTTAAALFLGLYGQGLAQGRQDFVLVNRTGSEIEGIFISPTNSNNWGEDILDGDSLDDGATGRIPQESPYSGSQMGPNISVKTSCCWSRSAKRSMSGSSLCSGMVGMSS